MPTNKQGSKYTTIRNQVNGEEIITERRRMVGQMYLEGFWQEEIAKKLQVTQALVSMDLEVIKRQWMQQAVMAFSERQALELAKIDSIERLAAAEYHRSRKNAVTVKETEESQVKFKVVGEPTANKKSAPELSQEVVPARRGRERTVRGRLGEDKYLARIAWCVEMRCKILGIIKDNKPSNVNVMAVNWQEIAGAGSGAEEIENAIRVIEGNAGSHARSDVPAVTSINDDEDE